MVSGISGGGLRLPGLATGMDTDEMIKKMLLGQQAKIDKANQDKQKIVWKQEIYRDIIKDLKDLQNAYFSVTAKENLNSNSSYFDYVSKVNSGTSATITGGQGVIEGDYTILVNKLAKGSIGQSKQLENLDVTKTVDLNTKLKDVKDIVAGDFTIKVGDNKAKIVVSEEDTIKTLIEKIKNADMLDADGNIVKIGDANDKLSNHINVSFSELKGHITMETKITGDNAKELGVEGTNFLGLTFAKGQDAEVNITNSKGETALIKKSSNNFTIDGATYNLTGIGTTQVNISQDVDKTFDRIKTFLNKYNALVDKINKKITEKKEYSYKPLTDEQRKDMKEDDIKAWEEKAKQGILRNDENLEKMLSELRSTFFTPVSGSTLTFNRKELGLDTSNIVSKAGQIEFTAGGEETLKKALREKPEEIMNLFNKAYTLSPDDLKETKEKQKELLNKNSGIFQRVNNILKDYVGLAGTTLNNAILTEYANKQDDFSIYGSGDNKLPDQIHKKDILIKQLNQRMKDKETQLYKQFAALEKVMNSYNSQASWLAQQFGGGQ